MTVYIYENKITTPNIDQIIVDVSMSEMIDKNIQRCRWEESEVKLYVYFDTDLIQSDLDILNGIVANNEI